MSDDANRSAVYDKSVFGAFELLGLTFALPFGEDLYHGTGMAEVPFWHWVYLAIGILFAAAGPLWPRIRNIMSGQLSARIGRTASEPRTWLAILLILFVYGIGAKAYRRIPLAPNQEMIAALQSQLTAITQERDTARQQLAARPGTDAGTFQNDPQLAALQRELATTKQRLFAAERSLEAMGMPLDPHNPPIVDAYAPGPIFLHKYPKNEAAVLIDAVRSLNVIAENARNISPPELIGLPLDFGPGQRSQITIADIEKNIESAHDYSDRTKDLLSSQKHIVDDNQAYASELGRVLGNTGVDALNQAINQYIADLEALKRLNLPSDKMDRYLIDRLMGRSASLVNQAERDFIRWNISFTNTRAPEALHLLESYL
jgi:hypothetical protein